MSGKRIRKLLSAAMGLLALGSSTSSARGNDVVKKSVSSKAEYGDDNFLLVISNEMTFLRDNVSCANIRFMDISSRWNGSTSREINNYIDMSIKGIVRIKEKFDRKVSEFSSVSRQNPEASQLYEIIDDARQIATQFEEKIDLLSSAF